MHEKRACNLLGAAALTISDLMLAGAVTAAGVSASAAAAVVVLSTEPGLSVTALGRRIGLSQPAATRMVDTLAAHGLIERDATSARSVSVRLTAEGARMAGRILRSREEQLARIVGGLSGSEQQTLVGLLGKLLAGAYAERPDAARLCRLCDRACCVAGGQVCPVGQAERTKAAGRRG